MALDTRTRITRARIRLCLQKPYLSSALMRFPLIQADDAVPTLSTDGYHIYWNEDFVSRLTDAEIRGVLVHELMHVLTQSVKRRQDRDPTVWNMATDYAINLVLVDFGFIIPAGGLINFDYAGLSAEEIYDRLMKKLEPNPDWETAGKRSSRASGAKADNPAGTVPDPGADLLDPDSIEVRRTAALQGIGMPDAEQIEEAAVGELRELMQGLKAANGIPESIKDILEASTEPIIDWRTLLADWMYDRIRDDWSAWPPSKKHIARGFFLPSVGAPAPIRLVMLIDTSASVSDEFLQQIFGEIREFRETFPSAFVIVQADDCIRRIDEYEAYDDFNFSRVEVEGRGGTSFTPAYEWIEDRFDMEPVAVIHATDGFGDFPKDCRQPVVFLIPEEAEKYDRRLPQFPKWGQKIVL